MSIRKKGITTARIVGSRYRFDPATGVQFVQVWAGFEEALVPIGEAFKASGAVADIQQDSGSWYRMEVSFGSVGGVTPGSESDTWERTVEYTEQDIFTLPAIWNEMVTFANPASYRKTIKDAVEDGDETITAMPPATYPNAYAAYRLLSRGAEAYETTHIVLTRRRTIPIGYTAPRTPSATAYIYTTAQLVAAFNIPVEVQAILPATPASILPEAKWSWKVRQDSSTLIPDLFKTEEVMSWTFREWSTVLYVEI